MSFNKFQIIILFLSFIEILSEEIPIKHSEKITLESGNVCSYFYHYSNDSVSGDDYFYFRFESYILELKIIEGEGNETNVTDIKINGDVYWYGYHIISKKDQKFIFQPSTIGNIETIMIFLDSSLEINLKLENFINYFFITQFIYENYEPNPLIFNIETIENDIFYNFIATRFDEKNNKGDKIIGESSLLNYCIIDEKNECNYKKLNSLKFERGKNYKIKLNGYKHESKDEIYYYFNHFSTMEEIKFGITVMNEGNITFDFYYRNYYTYFIFNFEEYEKFYVYSNGDYYVSTITEDDKEQIFNNIDNFPFTTNSTEYSYIIEINANNNKYLLIKINKFTNNYNPTICIVNKRIDIVSDGYYEIEGGINALLYQGSRNSQHAIMVSSNENLGFINSNFKEDNINNKILFFQNNRDYIYLNLTKEKSTIKYYTYDYTDYDNKYLYFELILKKDLNIEENDSLFKRSIISDFSYNFKNKYFFNFEDYYLYIKKIFGKTKVYEYNKELNEFSDIPPFLYPTNSYEDYKLIENELIIIPGYKLLSFIIGFNSLFDVYIQKVDDKDNILINSTSKNFVKLLIKDKKYYLDLDCDYLIKLDNKFLNAKVTFKDENGNQNELSKENKIIKDLKGNNIIITSTENALLYFYKKLINYSDKGAIVFDKSKKGKNMKFNIKSKNNDILNITIVKDFGYSGYYPMLNKEFWEKIELNSSNSTIFVENYYDNFNPNIDENEDYIIYIFDSIDNNNMSYFNSENYEISNPEYIKNLLTSENKYNFEVILPNSTGNIILSPKQPQMKYQFLMCQSTEIKFKIENLRGDFENYQSYPYEQIIKKNEMIIFKLDYNETLIHTFESDNEFLFVYNDDSSSDSVSRRSTGFKILSINEIKTNNIRINFDTPYSSLNRFYLIAAKKNELNNKDSFSNICYVAKLMINNSDSIIIKTIYENQDKDIFSTEMDLTQLKPNKNDIFVLTVIDESLFTKETIQYYQPVEFKLEQKVAKEIKLGEKVKFDFEYRNYFKFEYKNESATDEILFFSSESNNDFYLILYEPDSNKMQSSRYERRVKTNSFKLSKSGIYYFEICFIFNLMIKSDEIFILYKSGRIIDTIDLSWKIYNNNIKIETNVQSKPSMIKVNNLIEDKYVCFSYKVIDQEYKTFSNPFKICEDNNNINTNCTENIFLYKFSKEKNYIIYIDFVTEKDEHSWHTTYYFPSYSFFPIYEDEIEEKKEGYYIISEPKLYYINNTNKHGFNIVFKNEEAIYSSETNNNFSLDSLSSLSFEKNKNSIYLKTYSKYLIVIIIPSILKNPTKFVIVNKYVSIMGQGDFKQNAGEYYLINYVNPGNQYNPNNFKNIITTFSSPINNLKIFSETVLKEETEEKDFISLNFFNHPIYYSDPENNTNLTIKIFNPKFSFFYFTDEYLMQSDSNEFLLKYRLSSIFDSNYVFYRVNSNSNSFYDFFNFYFYNMKGNINVYIKVYYGNPKLYEYNPELINKDDFSILYDLCPFSVNRTSMINKVINLYGNKLFMGYLDYNSYLDVYYEKENNNILDTQSFFLNGAKYLKKDKEYTIDFNIDHLFKLEPGFNAEVTIYDDNGKIIKLNDNNPTAEIKGYNYKIKSNNDAMIYFYNKLMEGMKQYKIDSKQVGMNLEIKSNEYIMFVIDFGFEGYSPIDVFRLNYNNLNKGGTIFIENIYDKLKVNLTKGENLYFYYQTQSGKEIKEIKYVENLNHKNNDYNFNYIPKNSGNKTLIISNNNENKNKIRYQINYCNYSEPIKMFYQNEISEEILMEYNNDTRIIDYNVSKYSHRIRFESENDFVFSYSFYDKIDSEINGNEKWNEEREVLTNLTIDAMSKKYPDDNTSDIFLIKFKANYLNSPVRYIIIIASNDENNSKENFNNSCYITQLINEKAKGSKIIDIYDVGKNDTLEIEVDINDILGETDKYIINIISQELRFDKKLNYYSPLEFIHRPSDKKEEDEDDDDGFPLVYIVAISVVGFIIILAIILLVIRHCKRKGQDSDLSRKTGNLSNEKLMEDL